MNKINTRFITRIAIFGAVSSLLYIFIKFPFPLIPPFLEMNFSDVPAIIGTFAFGPLSGALIQVTKIVVKIVTVGSSTSYVGELADLLLGIVFVLPAGLYYQKNRTFKGAIIGSLISLVVHTLLACIFNYLFLLPFYIDFYFGGNAQSLIDMANKVNPYITDAKGGMVLWAILPFNIIKNLINILITFIVYKRMKTVINKSSKKSF